MNDEDEEKITGGMQLYLLWIRLLSLLWNHGRPIVLFFSFSHGGATASSSSTHRVFAPQDDPTISSMRNQLVQWASQ